ncbi:MAG: hypothetical protein NO114_00530 [Sulfolobales archaeon]|nr:hypothetical protein [Sulfolobales archaeon]MCQ4384729.1 hypothetical protein [Sulfolobales archaeon]MCQ4407059.1 hypothetical protein [Sulfolobales archaeon]MCQ4448088.1 hypothetical protein [Sulfolobales archaeon]MCQ4449748.1 hypothetical protein [Sulfolobales archaeon]
MSQPGSQTKSKELKLVTKQVVTSDSVKEDKRKLQLLYLISNFDGISEKALLYAISELKNKGLDLGYNIVTLGNNVTSPQVKDDLTALLYLGLLENDQAKMLKVSSNGKDFLESNPVDEAFKNQLTSLIQELKEKIKAIDEEQRLRSRRRGRGF